MENEFWRKKRQESGSYYKNAEIKSPELVGMELNRKGLDLSKNNMIM